MKKIIRKFIKEQIKALHESKKHVVKYSKSNNTYQVWLGDEIVTDFATKEKANAKAKNLNDLQNAKDVDKAQLKEAARELGYLDEIGNFHDPRMSSGNFDHLTPKKEKQSLFLLYLEGRGKFYKATFNGQNIGIDDVNRLLRSKDIDMTIPSLYDDKILDKISDALKNHDISMNYIDNKDVSEGDPGLEPVSPDDEIYGDDDRDNFPDFKEAYTSEWDPETAAKNQEYIKKSKKERELKAARAAFEKAEMNGDIRGQELALAAIDLIKGKRIKGLSKPSRLKEMSTELGYLNEITVSGGQEAARNYPPTEDPGDMFTQKEVEELLPASFASRNQELKARIQAHANWAKQDRFNNTFVHFQSNTVTDGNNTYRIGMSQHYNVNYEGFKNPKFTEIRVKELDDEFDMEKDLGYYIVDTTALMQDLKKLKTIERVS